MVSEVEMRDRVRIIPISLITVENPRERSEKPSARLSTVSAVGLKKPITVARVDEEAGSVLSSGLRSGSDGGLCRPWKPTSRPSL